MGCTITHRTPSVSTQRGISVGGGASAKGSIAQGDDDGVALGDRIASSCPPEIATARGGSVEASFSPTTRLPATQLLPGVDDVEVGSNWQ